MTQIWFARDLPVLRAVVEMTDEGHDRCEVSELAERTGLDEASVQIALWALAAEQPAFFAWTDLSTFGGREIGSIRMPTGHARRTVGAWPTPETLADQIVAAMMEAAEVERDPDQKNKLRKVAEAVGDAGRTVVVGVLTNYLGGHLP